MAPHVIYHRYHAISNRRKNPSAGGPAKMLVLRGSGQERCPGLKAASVLEVTAFEAWWSPSETGCLAYVGFQLWMNMDSLRMVV